MDDYQNKIHLQFIQAVYGFRDIGEKTQTRLGIPKSMNFRLMPGSELSTTADGGVAATRNSFQRPE